MALVEKDDRGPKLGMGEQYAGDCAGGDRGGQSCGNAVVS